mmetsp:Transcript_71611/g.158353  ORF Transcript_71611/g.158353 Transcript_71611/m.158353 type:complete len:99 (+) Transcript_71611:1226-1522(+)
MKQKSDGKEELETSEARDGLDAVVTLATSEVLEVLGELLDPSPVRVTDLLLQWRVVSGAAVVVDVREVLELRVPSVVVFASHHILPQSSSQCALDSAQ